MSYGDRFCLASYERILKTAKAQGYAFVTFEEYDPSGGKQIILRHDIDCLPSLARVMAGMDHEAGIRSTFCFMPDSALYNPYSQEDGGDLREIDRLGHSLGLHLDPTAWNEEWVFAYLQNSIRLGTEALRYVLGGLKFMPVVSWHSPSKTWLAAVENWEPRWLWNAMHRRFFKDGIAYLSDSNCRYSPSQLCDLLSQGTEHIQLLLHPLIWVAGGWDMPAVWANFYLRFLRDRERFILRTNSAYRTVLPCGITTDLLSRFSEDVQIEMSQGGMR
jgi:hypothetical protein